MKYIKFILPMLIIFLTIGFAATNVTLSISGDAYIASDLEDFEVYISSIKLNDTENITLLEDELTVTFSGDARIAINSPHKLAIQLTNNSSRFDAKVDIACNVSNSVILQVTDALVESLTARTSDSLTFLIDASNVSSSDLPFRVSCSFTPSPIERTEYGEGEVPDKIELIPVGQEVIFGTEKFNVIKDNGDTVTMLAQYNLGTNYRQSTTENAMTFSNSAGWEYKPGPKEIDIQIWSTYPKIYVNEYVTYLKKLTGDTTLSGNLITVTELLALGCTGANADYTVTGNETCRNSENYSWLVTNQSWWTRSAYPDDATVIWRMTATGNGGLYAGSYMSGNYGEGGYDVSHGIRPTITVSKEVLKNDFISFTLDGTSYLALNGMNINEWLNSIYNYNDYYLSSGAVYNSSGNRKATLAGDTIITEGLTVEFSRVGGPSDGGHVTPTPTSTASSSFDSVVVRGGNSTISYRYNMLPFTENRKNGSV